MKSPAAAPSSRPRRYRQRARAQAAADTHRRILDAFVGFLQQRWLEDITLEGVAGEAGVSAQTVIRRFGGKDGLLDAASDRIADEVTTRRRVEPGAPAARIVGALVGDYEHDGDLVIRLLAQEGRHPSLSRLLDRGRAWHRAWLAEVFAPDLDALPPRHRTRALDALVVATDVYAWQLLRRDRGRSRSAVAETLVQLVAGALAPPRPTERNR